MAFFIGAYIGVLSIKEDVIIRCILVVTVVLVLSLATQALSHPPSEVQAQFDPVAKRLSLAVYHSVNDSSKHFVDRVIVELNGEKIIEQKFKSQGSLATQLVEYNIIDAQAGDEITVIARCNISGQKKAQVVVEEQVEEREELPPAEG